ncbi:hypothetical protein [Adlercreutzia rubneri]
MRAASNASTETSGAVIRNESRGDHQGAIVVDINATAAPVGNRLCLIVNDRATSYLGIFRVGKNSATFMGTQRTIFTVGVFRFVTRDLATRHLEMTTIPHEHTTTSTRFILGDSAAVHDEASSVVNENTAAHGASAVVKIIRTFRSFTSCNGWPHIVFCTEGDLAIRARYNYDRTVAQPLNCTRPHNSQLGAIGHLDVAAKRAVDGESVVSIPAESQRAGGIGHVSIDGLRRVAGQLLGSRLHRSFGNCLGILLGERRRHDSSFFACGRLFLTENLTV